MHTPLPRSWAVLAGLTLTLAASVGHAYPNKPITLVVPFAPGGNIDLTARALADPLGRILGQSVIVENKPGAGSMLGASHVARAAPDGYTLLLGHSGTHGTVPATYKNVSYNYKEDFVPIGGITYTPSVLVLGPNQPREDLKTLVKTAESLPQGISLASAGVGSFNHLTIELLRHELNLKALHVPYRGSAPAIADVLGGQVQGLADQLSSSLPYIREGKFHAVAQMGAKRSKQLPDIPTLAEQGYPNIEAGVYTGLFAPSNTPPEVVNKLRAALEKALQDPALIQRYESMGADMLGMNVEEFSAYVDREAQKWIELASRLNIQLD